jgi:transcriptional regulator with XRE-family HTH domain
MTKKRNASKAPTKQDAYLGQRIREARIATGMTQTELGELIGVSYQQIQKYEDGHNRVNGGRIGTLVTALNRPLSYFFPDATDVRSIADPIASAFMATKDGQKIATKFPRMPMRAKRAVMDLIDVLSTENVNG